MSDLPGWWPEPPGPFIAGTACMGLIHGYALAERAIHNAVEAGCEWGRPMPIDEVNLGTYMAECGYYSPPYYDHKGFRLAAPQRPMTHCPGCGRKIKVKGQ